MTPKPEPWNPEAEWKVRFWDRVKYVEVIVQAPSREVAVHFARMNLAGQDRLAGLSFVDCERVE